MRSLRSVASGLALGVAIAGVPAVPADAASCGTTDAVVHRDLRYARDRGVAPRLQSLDLYLPKRRPGCRPTPVVVWVHGGAFSIGDKAYQVRDKVRLFTHEGWAFASVNYRLAGDRRSGPTGGRYPAQPRDLARALALLHQRADEFHLRRDATMLLGHSAGAFLVALLATDASLLRTVGVPPSSVRCTVPLDTEGYDIGAQVAMGGFRERMFRNAFGDDPATWETASPIRLAAREEPASDFLMFSRGRLDRYQGNLAFRDVLRDAGAHADVRRVNPLTHRQVNEAVGKPGDTLVTPPLLRFLRACV
jgi:acetyl esterase/lipase